MTLKKGYLFDSHALLRLFQAEAGHEKIVSLLENIQNKGWHKYKSAINLEEIIIYDKKGRLAIRKRSKCSQI